MSITKREKLFKRFLLYHWLRPEVALLKYYQADQWQKWKFKEPSMDLLSGDGEFSFLTWGGEFDFMTDMYVNVPPMTIDDYFSNRDVYNVPFKKKVYKLKKKADIKITTGFDYSKGQTNKAKRLDLYRNFIIGDLNNGLGMIEDESYKSIFANSLNVSRDVPGLLADIRRILVKGGRVYLSAQDKKQVDIALYNLYRDKGLKLGKCLDRGYYKNMVDSVFDLNVLCKEIKRSGFKIVSKESYGSEIVNTIYQIGFRPMFPAFIEMYHSLSKEKFVLLKEKWVENLFKVSRELLDPKIAKGFGGKCFWNFLVLEKK